MGPLFSLVHDPTNHPAHRHARYKEGPRSAESKVSEGQTGVGLLRITAEPLPPFGLSIHSDPKRANLWTLPHFQPHAQPRRGKRMPQDSQNETIPLTAFLDASDSLDMALDRMAALFDIIQECAKKERSTRILTLARLGAELAEQAEAHLERQSRAAKELQTRAQRNLLN